MDLGFRQVDEEGQPIRRTAAEVATIMALPEKRWVCNGSWSHEFQVESHTQTPSRP